MIHRQAGFTALELVVTLVIVGVVAIAVIPTLANVWGALAVNRTKGAAEQVATAIEQTRAYAILQSANYRIRFPGNNQLQIDCLSSCPTGAPTEGPTPLVNNGTIAPQGGADPTCGGDWCIFFNSTGTSSGGTLTVNPGNEPRTVTVTVAGRVRIT